MKRGLYFILALAMCLPLCACGGGAGEGTGSDHETSNAITSAADAAGTYVGVGIFFNDEYCLNENTTFDAVVGGIGHFECAGTYAVTKKNTIYFSSHDMVAVTFKKQGEYFYKSEGLMDCFEEDVKYGLKVTFDEDGHSNQTFEGNYGQDKYHYQMKFTLNEDGTYSITYHAWGYPAFDETDDIRNTYEGTYRLEDDILWLSYESNEYPMVFVDGKLYYDVFQKVE